METNKPQSSPQSQGSNARRGLNYLPLLPIVLGVVFLGYLLTLPSPGVHFSGDAGIKQYVLDLWSERGSVSTRVPWDAFPEWLQSIWQRHAYPLNAPYLDNDYILFPPFFLVLTWPLYRLFGYYGLFIIPAASLVGLWLLMAWHLRRRGFSPLVRFTALTMLVASPITYYGAMFWEHAPGLFCLFASYALLAEKRGRNWSLAAGALLFAAFALRPELIFAAMCVAIYAMRRRESQHWFVTGAVLVFLVWILVNYAATNSPLGLHGHQSRFIHQGRLAFKIAEYVQRIGMRFFVATPEVFGAMFLGLWAFAKSQTDKPERLVWLAIYFLTFFGVLFIVPNLGGLQIFLRYHLVLVIAAVIYAAYATAYRAWFGAVLLALIAINGPWKWEELYWFRWTYGARIRPMIEYIRELNPPLIFADNRDTFAEIAPRMRTTAFIRVTHRSSLKQLIREAAPHVDIDRAIVILDRNDYAGGFPLDLPDGRRVEIEMTGIGGKNADVYSLRIVESGNQLP